ncbi:MAG: hypothetical protein JXA94_06035 [Parachlamydiales bacterium]|nr:hypothetical protein [Parachlamydiales bacterium]
MKFKNFLFFIILTTASCAYAFNSSSNNFEKENFNFGYNPSSNINPDFFTSASYIFFAAKEKGQSFAFINYSTDRADEIKEFKFDYISGFKVELGKNLNYDSFSLVAKYMFYHPTYKENETVKYNSILSDLWHTTTLNSKSIHAKWILDMDLGDIILRRLYQNSEKLSLGYFFGLFGGRINQKEETKTEQLTSNNLIFAKAKSNSLLIGPEIGIDVKWQLTKKFSFISNSSSALFFQSFKVFYEEENPSPPPFQLQKHEENRVNYFNPKIDLLFGFKWENHFSNNNRYSSIFLGYELDYYFNQNMMRHLKDLLESLDSKSPGDLVLNGAVLTLQIGF